MVTASIVPYTHNMGCHATVVRRAHAPSVKEDEKFVSKLGLRLQVTVKRF